MTQTQQQLNLENPQPGVYDGVPMADLTLPQLAGADTLTHSRLTCLKTCPKKHMLQYELGLVPDRTSTPLRVGGNVHLGLELLSKGEPLHSIMDTIRNGYSEMPPWAKTDEDAEEWLTECETVIALVIGYQARWADANFKVVASELPFEIPIRNPDTGRSGRLFTFAGKIDRIIRCPDGTLAVLETKTTSDNIEFGSDYWSRLRIDTQISGYMLAARALGYDVKTVWYDVIRKPQIRPKNLTKTDRAVATSRMEYFGLKLVEVAPERETPLLFGARLTHDVQARGEMYYQRQEIPRLDSDLLEFERELWDQAQIVNFHRKHQRWPRNTAACVHPYPCAYRNICFNGIDVTDEVPAGFRRVEAVHQELI